MLVSYLLHLVHSVGNGGLSVGAFLLCTTLFSFLMQVTLANNAASALQNWGLSFQFAQNQLISIVNGLSVAPGYRLPAPGKHSLPGDQAAPHSPRQRTRGPQG